MTHRETERKYDAPEAARLPDPGVLSDLDATQPQEVGLDAVYYDTSDLRLAGAGITLRRREGGSDEGWHLKLPAGPDTRNELRAPLGRGRTRPPTELATLTTVHTRGRPLLPIARLSTRRRSWVLADPDGRALAEVAEDDVVARLLGIGEARTAWREIEVELTDDAPADLLDRIESRLREVGARRSQAPSKLHRVLGERLPDDTGAGAGEPQPKHPRAGAVVLERLRAQTQELRGRDPQVRVDTPDALHRMRVAARRMRSILQAHRRVLDRDATAHLIAELKWLGAELAPARDTEVMAARFTTMVEDLPADVVLGPVTATVTRTFARRQADARDRALAALDSARYLALHDEIDALLADPPFTRRARRRADRELPRALRRSLRRTRVRMERTAAPGTGHDAALHETRKAAKRLRYTAEVAEPVLGKRARRLRKRAKAVQSLLGEHQDSVVARPVLRELGAQAHHDATNGFTFGVLHGAERARADQLEKKLPATWAKLVRPRTIGWL